MFNELASAFPIFFIVGWLRPEPDLLDWAHYTGLEPKRPYFQPGPYILHGRVLN
jgi:hypothetical protein